MVKVWARKHMVTVNKLKITSLECEMHNHFKST